MAGPPAANDIRILCPYAGALINEVETSHHSYTLTLEDTALLKGLFFQWIRPQVFQVNTFLYQSSDINYSSVWGGHLMGDVYFLASRWGTGLAGAGSELISINMDADSNSMPMTNGGHTSFSDFEMQNMVYTPFIRAGYKLSQLMGIVRLSVFPWAGVQYQGVRGKMEVDFPVFQYPTHADIVADDWFALAGLGVNANIFHFIDLEGKYHATFDADTLYPTISAMANVFLTRHIGLSYRFKYMEMSTGTNTFHMGGVAFVF
ncbi:MAG: hypothetical protein A2268_14630 [Candidatus Raymondbacteria bacterium RifOxyA12_full_50_37]|uniref:Outer membrane protein beta-barrel domain-containing protein n=1 Tax=Candidatus Raymondbacteria bacterium RIFOXYD12_FULL_49_13 TaxID=1817890 RepID=A0A1F7F2R5_UNCRA|nr:MAG: hypothetical protein A2268_14630 [Candidatus Raymondbacteria bacterium RifOxyA12_full_50_37]OGJ87801.1 MAG: hypothetical protein A2350_12575 [Candidatus Raymondbacteria bacterium RifOxyB12_full_50_8]OGJ88655.1 MAG: hypothetical protein A2248_20565 [Candidatus Raymondbacteria bacterium RIFOXYA2_FULL_49_16]OGK00827.1 MAG: hypothetical protein A2519_07820 [Candidatus Raymondbacteria bacterium RIFOXYD12_FULL_49_13]OGK02869.1 MAG: hypothetical protein A2487_17740 [Candidatus Raymondbacteria 